MSGVPRGFPIVCFPGPNLEGNRQTGFHDARRAIYMLPPLQGLHGRFSIAHVGRILIRRFLRAAGRLGNLPILRGPRVALK